LIGGEERTSQENVKRDNDFFDIKNFRLLLMVSLYQSQLAHYL